jgi:hypothetical protein
MTLVLTLLLALAGAPPPAPSPKPSPPPAAKPSPEPAPAEHGQSINVRLDIKLTERRGEGEPVTKVITMTIADRRNGMIRAANGAQPGGGAFAPAALNVDATPTVDTNGKIRLSLGLEYNVNDPSPDAKGLPMRGVREQFFVIAESGRPLVVADSADPVTDRRLQVEVTATILR